ncbi:MAG: hypothetical protein IJR91_05645 [Ruminococcus sp.]|nr:hypothetical protein [Ruminococcus sp.]
MLGELLSKEECAGCRLCCSFHRYDLMDTPTVTADTAVKIVSRHLPEQKFLETGGSFLMKMEPEPDGETYFCPLLDHRRGCIMGDSKPFECRIWPLRVMRREDRLVIALSPLCPVINLKPIEEVKAKCGELAETILQEAAACPELAKPFAAGHRVLYEITAPKG